MISLCGKWFELDFFSRQDSEGRQTPVSTIILGINYSGTELYRPQKSHV